MTESRRDETWSRSAAHDRDELAARLLAAHRFLHLLDADTDARIRLHVRFLAICASLKLPGASRGRVLARLDQLLGDADRAARAGCADRAGQPGEPGQRCP